MALSQQLGFPNVPKSSTNPNVSIKDALDNDGPMSFLTFIKVINITFEPDTLQKYYTHYIRLWNNTKNSKLQDDNVIIVERYRDFLKDLSLNYTTLEEKKYLSSIDFNDPYDLDIVMGFYSRKLKDIIDYYNNKRNDVKFNITRKKLEGSNYGLDKTIKELTLSYLKTLENGKILYNYDNVNSKIEVEIDELYNNYPYYFNQEPNSLIYDRKDLDYGLDIFLKDDSDLISEVFSGFSDILKDIKEVDQLFENKRKLSSKYLSTDFYYLSTGDTVSTFLSGKILDAESPASNFFNIDYPTTASTEASTEYLITKRDMGFFKPSNVSIVLVDGNKSSFSYNLSNLKPNTIYYFPDPNIIGENGDILTFIVDDSYLKRNSTSGMASNQPYSAPTDTKYYGYISKTEPQSNKYLDTIFDLGYIKDQKRDVYGNLFGLFVDDGKFNQSIKLVEEDYRTNILINGYKFYDTLYGEGSTFNYTTFDNTTFNETIRSGLSTNVGTLSDRSVDYTLFFGTFGSYRKMPTPTDENLKTIYNIVEGAFIMNGDTFYNDAISSDLSSFEYSTGPFYYTTLHDAALHDASPLQRALLDPLHPTLTANLTEYIRSSSILDGGYFGVPDEFTLSLSPSDTYYDGTFTNTTQFDLNVPHSLNNGIYIRNTSTKEVQHILDAMPYIQTKFSNQIVSDIDTNSQYIDMINDVLFIETNNYLTINKIVYQNSKFIDPKTNNIYLNHSFEDFDKISNRFKVKNDVYFCKMNKYLDDFIVYPTIYKFDIINFKLNVIFGIDDLDISMFDVIGNTKNTHCDKPVLTHSSRNNIFNISVLVKDQNNYPTIHSYDFHLNPDVEFLNHKVIYFGNNSISNIFYDTSVPTTFNTYLSSGVINTINEELIL